MAKLNQTIIFDDGMTWEIDVRSSEITITVDVRGEVYKGTTKLVSTN